MARKKKIATAGLKPFHLKAQLVDLRMIACRSALQPRVGVEVDEFEQKINVLTAREPDKVVKFQITASLATKNDDPPLFIVEAVYGVIFKLEEQIDDLARVKALGQQIGVTQIWPYWREMVQTTMIKMGLLPFLVPIVTVQELAQMSFSDDSLPAAADEQAPVSQELRKRKR